MHTSEFQSSWRLRVHACRPRSLSLHRTMARRSRISTERTPPRGRSTTTRSVPATSIGLDGVVHSTDDEPARAMGARGCESWPSHRRWRAASLRPPPCRPPPSRRRSSSGNHPLCDEVIGNSGVWVSGTPRPQTCRCTATRTVLGARLANLAKTCGINTCSVLGSRL